MSKEQVEQQERIVFKRWINKIYDNTPLERLNYFEHNLEVLLFTFKLNFEGVETIMESM